MSVESDNLGRREFMRRLTGAAAAVGAAGLAGCSLSSAADEGAGAAAAGDPLLPPTRPVGQHTLLELPYPKDGLVLPDPQGTGIKGISAQVVEWHHDKHHAGYVKALNAIEQEIAALPKIEAAANYSDFTELKRRETFNASGMYLHEIYWLNMTPGGIAPSDDLPLLRKIVADFGSFDRWRAEFVGTAQTPNTGWAILALAPYDLRLHNFACSFHDLGGVWGTIPLIACDVWEHAYYYDYGPDRGKYLESFLRLLDWKVIDAAYRRWVVAVQQGVKSS